MRNLAFFLNPLARAHADLMVSFGSRCMSGSEIAAVVTRRLSNLQARLINQIPAPLAEDWAGRAGEAVALIDICCGVGPAGDTEHVLLT